MAMFFYAATNNSAADYSIHNDNKIFLQPIINFQKEMILTSLTPWK